MEEETSKSRKRKVGLIAGLFIGLLIMLTLVGNTIQALTLPKVLTVQAATGSLSHSYASTATVQPKEERELTNPAGWKVARMLVKKGDRVHKDQTLIEYDGSDIKQQIADGEAALKKLNLSMEQLKYNVIQAMQAEDEAAKISAASALETAKLDRTTQQQHNQQLKNNLAANDHLAAPYGGIVTDVGAIEGYASSGAPDIRISNSAKGYNFELLIPSDIAAMLSVGESLQDIKLIGKDNEQLGGKIERMDDMSNQAGSTPDTPELNTSGSMQRIVIALESIGLHGGERVEVHLTKTKDSNQLLVPNQAIHKDSEGSFVYTIKETQGPLGNAYYAVRTPVTVSDSNDSTTAISEGLFDEQEVLVESNDLIMDGTRVHK
ncbi:MULTISPECIES: efflux RND transporter periplasmic adaptor subunit [unclassified Paenibacillus]|uniref:efflux RND transporter periplasmic adaptor subunit n=1 Tax=unclassified Paenibacillus TaxID=185978 RepID=UPI0030FACB5D